MPLAGTESQWIEAVIKTLILRVGLREEIEHHPWIDMGDLPKLESAQQIVGAVALKAGWTGRLDP